MAVVEPTETTGGRTGRTTRYSKKSAVQVPWPGRWLLEHASAVGTSWNQKTGANFSVPVHGITVLAQAVGAAMGRVLNDILLLICMAGFVTGVVIAAASLLG